MMGLWLWVFFVLHYKRTSGVGIGWECRSLGGSSNSLYEEECKENGFTTSSDRITLSFCGPIHILSFAASADLAISTCDAIHSTPQLGSIGFGHSGDGDGNIFMSENMRRAASTGPWTATQYIYIWLKQLHVCVCVCCSVVITLLLYRFVRESRESEAKQKEREHFVQRSHCRRRRRRRIIAVVRRQFTSNRKYCQDLLLFTSNYYCYC